MEGNYEEKVSSGRDRLRRYIRGIMDSPDLEIGALCDILPERIEDKKKLCGASDDMCYSVYTKMLDSGKVDAVSICTPNYLHYEMAMESIKRGIGYAVEKPACNNARDAAVLLEETAKKQIPHMVCFSYRFISAARYARDLVKSGALGRIYHISGEYFQSWGLPNPKTGALTPRVWRFDKEQAITGALGDLGCHMIDLLRFMTGCEFTRIIADYDTFVHKRPMLNGKPDSPECDVTVDDYVDIAGQMEGPIAANLSITRFAYSRSNYQRVEIYGDKGAVRYHLDTGNQLEIIGGNLAETSQGWNTVPVPEKYNSNQMQSFADILNGCGDGLAADMNDGWQTQRVIDAAVTAAENTIKL